MGFSQFLRLEACFAGGGGGGARLKRNKRGVGARFIGFEARLARLKKSGGVGGCKQCSHDGFQQVLRL